MPTQKTPVLAKLDGNNIAAQSNTLIETMYKIGLNAKKLMLCVISQIHPDDTDFEHIKISIKDYKRLVGIDSKMDYRPILHKSVEELWANSFCQPKDGGMVEYIPLAGKYSRPDSDDDRGYIIIAIDPGLKPHLLNLKQNGNFTAYRIKNTIKMRSVYSIRMYELLKHYVDINHLKNRFELDDLRAKLGVAPDKLTQIAGFRQKVLDVAKKELPEKTDLDFTYTAVRQGRNIRWIDIQIIKKITAVVLNNGGAEMDVTALQNIPSPILAMIPQAWRNHPDIIRDIAEGLRSKDVDYVRRNLAYTIKRSKKADGFSAYLGNALKNDWGKQEQLKIFKSSKIAQSPKEILAQKYQIMPGKTLMLPNGEKIKVVDEGGVLWARAKGGTLLAQDLLDMVKNIKVIVE